MSMSEFDTQMNSGEDDFSSFSCQKQVVPPDFSEEDLAFAQELNTLFSPEQEELPPYFVQTLLQAEDSRFRPVEHGFEKKTSARVFHRLKLRRRLFRSHRSTREVISTSIHGIAVNRSLLAFAAVLMLVMIFTVAFTAPSFTSGVAFLLQGTRSGVYGVQQYPDGVNKPHIHSLESEQAKDPHKISLLKAQQKLSFPMYWPQMVPGQYSSPSIFLEDTSKYAVGPILDLVYNLNNRVQDIDSQIVVHEFRPKEDVLQVVHEGAAYPLDLDQYGQAKAIYVEGQWALQDGQSMAWVNNGRSELIYQQDGIVFWIVGNQHSGVDEKTLLTIAESLQVFQMSHQMLSYERDSRSVTLIDSPPDQFTTDVVFVLGDNGDNPSYIALSSYQSVQTMQKILATGH